MELRELRYFTVLCEELHFGRAAERLHISQSPLSQAIAQLERKLGTRLLDRSSRHVQLTPAGGVLLHHARRMLRDAEAAAGATRRAGAGENGVLLIAVGPAARDALLPALRHALDERLPALTVEVVELAGDDVAEAVLCGAADAGLMMCPPTHDGIEQKLLRRDLPVAVLGPAHPLAGRDRVTVEELSDYRLVLRPRSVSRGAHDVILGMFHGHPPAATRITEAYSGAGWDAMHADGFSVVAAAAAVSGDFVTVPIADGDAAFSMSLVWSRDTPPLVLPALLEAADSAVAANGWR
ncbi:MAG: LysR family transcriptional regulator [Actinobacteria bacterium]|nr:MAG: LysR family transcriptional regulator [Actinomycetota bacterium]